MVAIFTGQGWGIQRGSGSVLGSSGLLGSASYGRGGENVLVNAANGNLFLSQRDEFLVGRGPDVAIGRSYNSLTTLGDDNNDRWRQTTDRRVYGLTGTLNTAGSTVRRVAEDGSETVFTWDAGRSAYVSRDGGGAIDTLVRSGSDWIWTDGDSRVTEHYGDAQSGMIRLQTDLDGNALTFTYLSGKLDKVTTADGGWTQYEWSGNNITRVITGFTDLQTGGSQTLSRVWYEYTSNRLTRVRVDLTPSDNTLPTDAQSYWTSYGYDANGRVNLITQKDGSSLAIAYDGSGRVTSLTETATAGVTRVTQLAYGAGFTDITDPTGKVTRLQHDAAGNLTRITAPAAFAGAAQQVVQFAYNGNGDLTSVTDALSNVTSYTYDANGNLLTSTDRLGNVVTRSYGSLNELLSETRTASDASGAAVSLTTRYAYDGQRRLRYVVSGQGMVTEYRYNTQGQLTFTVQYPAHQYPVGAGAISVSGMDTWRNGLADRSSVKITANAYDARGNLLNSTAYAAATTAGVELTTDGWTRTNYVYNQAGWLLNSRAEGQNSNNYVYDGMGRLTAVTDANGGTTSYVFNDTATTTVVTMASGLVTTQTYNKAGDLISVTESGAQTAGGTVSYQYDKMGRVKVTTSATGGTFYTLYDAVGRKVADVNQFGDMVEYRYDANDRLVAVVRYQVKVSAANLTALANPDNTLEAASIRPASSANDVWAWTVYDKEGRVLGAVDGDGGVTAYGYDASGRQISAIRYANKLSSATISAYKTTAPTTLALPTADPTRDAVSRQFFDRDGRLIGVLDGEGYLTRTIYDQAGQAVEVIGYATITNSTLRASGSFDQLVASVGSSTADRRSRNVYDGQGLLRYSVDAANAVTSYQYNNAGQLVQTTRHAAALGALANYSFATVKSAVNALATTGNRTSWAVYDAAGRLAFMIDPAGGVSRNIYDTSGRVIRVEQFATPRATTSLPTQATMDSWAAGVIADGANRITRTWYNERGEARYVVDAEGYITRNDFDAAGRLVKTVRFDTKVTVADNTSYATVAGLATGAFVETSYAYRADGKLESEWDGEGVRTFYTYNAAGQVDSVYAAYGTVDESRTVYAYDAAGRVIAETSAHGQPEAATTSYLYDGLGNRTRITDPLGRQTNFTFDRSGRMLTSTNALGGITRFEYNGFGHVWKTTDPRGSISYTWYDTLGRATHSQDAENYLTRTIYTTLGDVQNITRFFNQAPASPTMYAAPSVTANASEDATTSFGYDLLGRRTSMTDAMGFVESYGYDAFSNRTSMTNKLGGVTSYTYDRRGLVTTETTNMATYDSAGTYTGGTVRNRFIYDARGNMTSRIEADNLAYNRTTTYVYDKANRLTETRGNQVQVVADDLITSSPVTPTQIIRYDRRGNVVEQIAADGGRTLSYYDDLNRRIVEIDALGTYSRYFYDTAGNLTAKRVHGTAVALPATAGGTAPAAPGGEFRETTMSYDGLNRLTSSSVANIFTGVWNGTSYVTQTSALTTSFAYDANGNLTSETDANGNASYKWYDKLGRVTHILDKEGALTVRAYDPDGNVTSETRFVTRFLGVPGSSPPVVSGGTDDRTTNFTYDRNGRRLTESRLRVAASTVNGSGGLATSSVTATISYLYNGLGQVTRKTEATGEQTNYAFDSYGRLTTETRAAFTDHNNAGISPITDYYYDGLGNLTRTRNRGTSGSAERVSRFIYGAGGRLASSIDAAGFTRTYEYDAAGRIKKESYTRTRSDGTTTTDAQATRYDLLGRVIYKGIANWNGSSFVTLDYGQIQFNAYGDVWRQGSNGAFQVENRYDAAGRLLASNNGDGIWKYFGYDRAGNQTLAITSAGYAMPSGATLASMIGLLGQADVNGTYTVYDKRGQATQVVEEGRQLTATTSQQLVSQRSYNSFGEVVSETNALGAVINYTYNTMGRRIRVESPFVTVVLENGGSQSVRPVEESYYDASGRLVGSRGANNALTTRSLLAGTGYGNSEALVTAVFNPDGGVARTHYDVHGDARRVVDEMGRTTTQTFDAMGRVTQISRPGGFVESYAYDGLGQRIQQWNNLFQVPIYGPEEYYWVEDYWHPDGGYWQSYTPIIGYDPEKMLMDYDSLGRLTMQKAFGGDVSTTSYAWNGTLSTAGIGTFGGWQETTTYANGRTSIQRTDIYGRDVSRVDMGGRTTSYSYDAAGRLTQRNVGGTALNFAYFNTGLMSEMFTLTGNVASQNWNKQSTKYGYNAVGSRISEMSVTEGEESYEIWHNPYEPDWYYNSWYTVTQNATATYDALGRMTSFSEAGTGATPAASITYSYDANGNVRRVLANYRTLNANGVASTAVSTQDYWYRYDSMNRVVTSKGQLIAGQIVRGSTGSDIMYNLGGQRTRVTTDQQMWGQIYDPNLWVEDPYDPYGYYGGGGYYGGYVDVYYTGQRQEDYSYDAAGNLQNIYIGESTLNDLGNGAWSVNAPPATGALRASYTRDLAGRVTRQHEYAWGTTVAYDRTVTYMSSGRVSSESVTTNQSGTINRADTSYNYGFGTGYLLGAVASQTTYNYRNNAYQNASSTTNTYQWWDGAVLSSSAFKPNTSQSTTFTTSYYLNGFGQVASVYAGGGRPRSISFTLDLNGQAIRRQESDNNYNQGDPNEVWYRFGGRQLGHVSNNGTLDTDYATSISNRQRTTGTGAFRFGTTYAVNHADFDQNYDPINSYQQSSGGGGSYTVQSGDTLARIAQSVWGDASLWYKIAEANGLGAGATLVEGQSLTIPTGVVRSQNNANTFRPYDTSKTLGDTSPTAEAAKPPKKNKCGVFGQILLIVIAVAVTAILPVAAPGIFAAGGALGAVGGAMAAAAIGSVVSQAVGVATGIQDKFSWKGVAMAALSAGVGVGVGEVLGKGAMLGSQFVGDVVRGAVTSAVTQGVAVATGLQKKFDWAGVAVAGIGAGVTNAFAREVFGAGTGDVPKKISNIEQGISSLAGAVAGAGARSLLTGTSFGDNILKALPSVVGKTIGSMVAGAVNTAIQRGNLISSLQDEGLTRAQAREVVQLVNSMAKSQSMALLNAGGKGPTDQELARGIAGTISRLDALLANATGESSELINGYREFSRNMALALISTEVYRSAADHDPSMIPVGYSRLTPAQLLEIGYDVTKFKLVDDQRGGSGYHAAIYRDPRGGLIYANRGTDNWTSRDASANAGQSLGYRTAQHSLAVDNARELQSLGLNVTYTGHSLGGGLATLQALVTGSEAVVFNAAGLNPETLENYGVIDNWTGTGLERDLRSWWTKSNANVTSYWTSRDELQAANWLMGNSLAGDSRMVTTGQSSVNDDGTITVQPGFFSANLGHLMGAVLSGMYYDYFSQNRSLLDRVR